MKNKYQLQIRVNSKVNKLNSFIMNEFCMPLKIPKMIIKAIKKYLKNRKYNFVGHHAVYNSLEVPSSMFKLSCGNINKINMKSLESKSLLKKS
jgi:hypothetical protein